MTNTAKGNARVGIQVGNGPSVASVKVGDGRTTTTYDNGVTETVQYVTRGPNHPAGQGETKIVSFGRKS